MDNQQPKKSNKVAKDAGIGALVGLGLGAGLAVLTGGASLIPDLVIGGALGAGTGAAVGAATKKD